LLKEPLKMPPSAPVIVVPGVTATYLRDLYPLPPETIWAVIDKDFERVQMHPDNLRYEARQPAAVRAGQLYEIAYKELIEELRHNLSERVEKPVPVFPFGYDWRHPLKIVEDRLAEFIDEVIDRTKLLRHYHKDGYSDAPKVNLVGHSMGGLVIAGYLERFGAGKIDKIATLAAPYKGSFEAMVKMATGTANFGGPAPSSREREAARLTPSLYHLLPSFETGIEVGDAAGLPNSAFDPRLWQPAILDTIINYIEHHAVAPGRTKIERRKQGETLFKALLDAASGHRTRIDYLNLDDKGFETDRWLCVVGVDAKTRARMTVEVDGGKPVFRLNSGDRLNEWGNTDPNTRQLTGDGTVHFKSAVPDFLPYESLVCVTPDDYGYWELADVVAAKSAGFHGILPNMNMVHRLLVRHFTGRGDPQDCTWGRRAPGVAEGGWRPPVWPLREK
jgi:pimeloyl-ACP methyl ester carboxylesterase